MDAGDRNLWTADQNTRPLSDLGRRQAQHFCDSVSGLPFDALYSSPALRCHQTLDPIARRFGLTVETLEGLRETDGWQTPAFWPPTPIDGALGGAYAAGHAAQALTEIRSRHSSGRIAVCTHGDTGPALIAYLMGMHSLELPALHTTRGGWYTIEFEADILNVTHHDVLADFPLT